MLTAPSAYFTKPQRISSSLYIKTGNVGDFCCLKGQDGRQAGSSQNFCSVASYTSLILHLELWLQCLYLSRGEWGREVCTLSTRQQILLALWTRQSVSPLSNSAIVATPQPWPAGKWPVWLCIYQMMPGWTGICSSMSSVLKEIIKLCGFGAYEN